MKDCIIIGSGPAGISAALTLQSNGVDFCVLGSPQLSDKITKAELIHNYPGLSDVTGKAFNEALKAQLSAAKIEIINQKAVGVYAMKGKFAVATQSGEMYESRTVILACGVESTKPIVGEREFLGRGVSYCATCDGFLYKGKKIAVLCTSKSLEHEIEHLAGFAETVYLMPLYKGEAVSRDNVCKILKKPTAIEGERRVERICFSQPPSADIPAQLPVDGVFILKENVAAEVMVGGLRTENGHVLVGRDAATNLKGCFAAGDCTGRPYQYAKAVGEGNVAAHAVSEYLAKNTQA